MDFLIKSLPLKKYIIAFIIAFLATVGLQGILGILFSFFHPPQFLINFVCSYMSYLSAFVAALLCAKGAEKNGLITGMISADTYMVILLLSGIIFFGNSCSMQSLIKLFCISSLCGAVGGIVGINFKK